MNRPLRPLVDVTPSEDQIRRMWDVIDARRAPRRRPVLAFALAGVALVAGVAYVLVPPRSPAPTVAAPVVTPDAAPAPIAVAPPLLAPPALAPRPSTVAETHDVPAPRRPVTVDTKHPTFASDGPPDATTPSITSRDTVLPPDTAATLLAAADDLRRRGDLPAAAAVLGRAMALPGDPQAALAAYTRANVLDELGRAAESRAALRRALELGLPPALAARARARLEAP